MFCKICKITTTNSDLCEKHSYTYMYDNKLSGYRLKKRNTGSRYTQEDFHKTEKILTALVEQHFGKSKVYTSFHPTWAVSPKGVLYEYDIVIHGEKLLIEYNGRQHYEFVPFFHKTLAKFFKQKRNDKIKRKLAKSNGYKLIVFKYDEPITINYVINKLEKR